MTLVDFAESMRDVQAPIIGACLHAICMFCVLNLSHTYKNALAKAHNAPTLTSPFFFLESASVTSTIPVTLETKKIKALLT